MFDEPAQIMEGAPEGMPRRSLIPLTWIKLSVKQRRKLGLGVRQGWWTEAFSSVGFTLGADTEQVAQRFPNCTCYQRV